MDLLLTIGEISHWHPGGKRGHQFVEFGQPHGLRGRITTCGHILPTNLEPALMKTGSIYPVGDTRVLRSEEHTSELQSLMRISYPVFCLKNTKKHKKNN